MTEAEYKATQREAEKEVIRRARLVTSWEPGVFTTTHKTAVADFLDLHRAVIYLDQTRLMEEYETETFVEARS